MNPFPAPIPGWKLFRWRRQRRGRFTTFTIIYNHPLLSGAWNFLGEGNERTKKKCYSDKINEEKLPENDAFSRTVYGCERGLLRTTHRRHQLMFTLCRVWGRAAVLGKIWWGFFFFVLNPFPEGVLSWGLSSTRRAWKNICSKFEWNLGGFRLMKNSLRINHRSVFQNLERLFALSSRKWLNCWKFLDFSTVARFLPTDSASRSDPWK